MITVEIFQNLCSFVHSASSGWIFEPALSAFIQLRQKHCDTTRKFRAFSCPIMWSVIFLFSFFFFFSRFYPIVHAFFLPKIWNYRQRSFSLPFKTPNLHPSLDIRHVDLRTSRVLWGSQWGCSKHGTRLIFWMFHATRLTPLRPSTNNTVIWTKIIHDTRLIFSLFHDTRLIFWMFHATRLTPLRPSFMTIFVQCINVLNYKSK